MHDATYITKPYMCTHNKFFIKNQNQHQIYPNTAIHDKQEILQADIQKISRMYLSIFDPDPKCNTPPITFAGIQRTFKQQAPRS